jgi:starch synthase
MRVLFVSSEVFPFSKTGGLADVAGALPRALAELHHRLLVVTPWYKTLKAEPPPLWIGDVDVPFDGGFERCGLGTLEHRGVHHVFIGHPYFWRDDLYGYADDAKRFAFFSRAVPQAAARVGFTPDLVHAHDWHSAYLPMILAHGWHLPGGFPYLGSVFTIHNVQFQGYSNLDETLHWLRLPTALRDGYLNRFGGANAMQAALGYAHGVTTVSPTYATEIKRPEYGYGLDGTLRHIAGKLRGILNGLDTDTWNPADDPHLEVRFSVNDLAGKRAQKRLLCAQLGLDDARPLLGVVSRLSEQKGIDLLLAALPGIIEQGWNLIVLGSGEGWMEESLRAAAPRYPGRLAGKTGHDEALAHKVYGASDAFAMPSRFEPCGLSQMIAMRYGSLPVARATGGLVDTIRHGQTGFLFEHAMPDGLLAGLSQALGRYRDGAAWQGMIRKAMQEDFSWTRSAQAYSDLYGELYTQVREAVGHA